MCKPVTTAAMSLMVMQAEDMLDCCRSMQPALNPALSKRKDRVLTDKLSIHLYSYSRGDVVTLWSPSHPQRLLIKRLIALEGDWLTVPGSAKLEKIPQERRSLHELLPFQQMLLLMPTSLQGCCWVEGDNQSDSSDSSSSFGPVSAPACGTLASSPPSQAHGVCASSWGVCMQVPLALVDARVLAVFWPPERIGRVHSAVPKGRLLRVNQQAVHGPWHGDSVSD